MEEKYGTIISYIRRDNGHRIGCLYATIDPDNGGKALVGFSLCHWKSFISKKIKDGDHKVVVRTPGDTFSREVGLRLAKDRAFAYRTRSKVFISTNPDEAQYRSKVWMTKVNQAKALGLPVPDVAEVMLPKTVARDLDKFLERCQKYFGAGVELPQWCNSFMEKRRKVEQHQEEQKKEETSPLQYRAPEGSLSDEVEETQGSYADHLSKAFGV